MNVYHISYVPKTKTLHLHFWGCNMKCRGCLRQEKLYEIHIKEQKFRDSLNFLSFDEVISILKNINFSKVIFMGMEATIDPELPKLAEVLHKKFQSYNVLLTNGLKLIPLDYIDEIVVSIKAYDNKLHQDYTGVSNFKILENFIKIYTLNKKLRAESVFIPEYIDYLEIEQIAKFIASVDKNIPYRIDAYLPVGNNPWRKPEIWEIEKAIKIAKKYLLNVSYLKGGQKLKYEVIQIY